MLRDWMTTFRGTATANPYGAMAAGSDLLADRIAERPRRPAPAPAASHGTASQERPAPSSPRRPA